MFIRVDLPEPDGPTMATISPAWIVRSMSFSTAMVPSPEGNSRRAFSRVMSGRSPASRVVIDLEPQGAAPAARRHRRGTAVGLTGHHPLAFAEARSEEHQYELQSLMRIQYDVLGVN